MELKKAVVPTWDAKAKATKTLENGNTVNAGSVRDNSFPEFWALASKECRFVDDIRCALLMAFDTNKKPVGCLEMPVSRLTGSYASFENGKVGMAKKRHTFEDCRLDTGILYQTTTHTSKGAEVYYHEGDTLKRRNRGDESFEIEVETFTSTEVEKIDLAE